MAYNCHRFVCPVNLLDEDLCLALYPQSIGIQRSSREQDGVKVVRICLIQRHIHLERVCLYIVIHSLNLSRLRRYDHRFCPDLFESFLWLNQFDLLEVVGNQDSNAHSVQQTLLHAATSYSSWGCSTVLLASSLTRPEPRMLLTPAQHNWLAKQCQHVSLHCSESNRNHSLYTYRWLNP